MTLLNERSAHCQSVSRRPDSIVLSVVVPCYNHGEFLLEAIASLENTGTHNWELIIVNDGSTEPITLQVLAGLKAKNYCVVDQPNQGLSAARNTGIAQACGRYILPLDADNCVKLPYLTQAIMVLDQHPEVGVVYGNLELFGERLGLVQVPRFSVELLLVGNAIDACAVFRRSIWEDVGGYDAKIPDQLGYEDWDFWLGVIERGWQFWHLEATGFAYRCREVSMVSACNLPSNRSRLFQYICAKHHALYAVHFPTVFGIKEAERLAALAECDRYQSAIAEALMDLEIERDRIQQLQDRQSSLLAELTLLRQQQQQAEVTVVKTRAALIEQQQQGDRDRQRILELEHQLTARPSWRSRLWRRLKRLMWT
ncbi:MAG: glycosyltransferase family 2 protein [Oscillatoriales cyanobacterium]|nr:MAG: glycosyltransferase family 2 protein [Oscillatoriales cyanobacterium]